MTEIVDFIDSAKRNGEYQGAEESKLANPVIGKKSNALKVYRYSTLNSIKIRDRLVECTTDIGRQCISED